MSDKPRVLNRYAIQRVDIDGGRRPWIIWDRQRQAAVEERESRDEIRESMKGYKQERVTLKEGDIA